MASASSGEPTTFQWVSFGVAAAGFVTAVAALVWQAVSFQLSGPHVRVETPYGVNPAIGERVVGLRAINTGRSPIAVTGWGFKLPGDLDLVRLSPGPSDARLPYTLEGGHGVLWLMPYQDIAAVVPPGTQSVTLVGYVRLATGKTTKAKKPITLKELPDPHRL